MRQISVQFSCLLFFKALDHALWQSNDERAIRTGRDRTLRHAEAMQATRKGNPHFASRTRHARYTNQSQPNLVRAAVGVANPRCPRASEAIPVGRTERHRTRQCSANQGDVRAVPSDRELNGVGGGGKAAREICVARKRWSDFW